MSQFFAGQSLRLRSDLDPETLRAFTRLVRPDARYYVTRVIGSEEHPLLRLAEYDTGRDVVSPHDLCPVDLCADYFEPVPTAA